jgi:hypothetical protein
MNVAVHELAGASLAFEAAARLGAPGGRSRGGGRVVVWTVTFALAVLSHGVLDGLVHYYPLGHWPDALVSLALAAFLLARVPPWLRGPLLATMLGALAPDIIDHVPRDLDRQLHLGLSPPPPLFPWHRRAGSGSYPGLFAGPLWLESLVNHGIVLAFCAAAMLRTRQVWLTPRSPRARTHDLRDGSSSGPPPRSVLSR